jgi:hypothetical protein
MRALGTPIFEAHRCVARRARSTGAWRRRKEGESIMGDLSEQYEKLEKIGEGTYGKVRTHPHPPANSLSHRLPIESGWALRCRCLPASPLLGQVTVRPRGLTYLSAGALSPVPSLRRCTKPNALTQAALLR